jgi:hypothetical protein
VIRSFIIITVLTVLTLPSIAQDTTKAKKKHKLTDTVGVVNGSVIRLYDFRELLSDIIRSEAPDSIVQDTEFTRYVNMTWERLVADILIYQEIEKRKLGISEQDLIKRLIKSPPKELVADFTTEHGFDKASYEAFLTNTEPDSARTIVLNYFHMQMEQDNLQRALAPKGRSERERIEAFAAWLKKAFQRARIDDRRTAFGYY